MNRPEVLPGLVALLSAVLAMPASASTIIVDAGSPSPYTTIQAGINASTSGDTVLVMPGTYSGTGNKDLNFNGREIVVVSFAGPQQTFIECGRYARGFLFNHGERNNAVVDGFTIRDGGIWTSPGSNGGGIYCISSQPTVRNCVFDQCFAYYIWQGGAGGGIYSEASDGMLIEDCVFVECNGMGGGGVYARGGAITLTRCLFLDCLVQYGGGGVSISNACSAQVSECTFIGGVSNQGSAGIAVFQSIAEIGRCTLAANSGPQGAVNLYQTSSAIRDCIVAWNSSPAMTCSSAPDAQTTHNIVFGNAGGDSLCGAHTDNLFMDPAFCDRAGGDVSLCADSPGLPPGNPWGESVGAFGQGCPGCTTPVRPLSWGSIKALYR
jgi:hypothetical protein